MTLEVLSRSLLGTWRLRCNVLARVYPTEPTNEPTGITFSSLRWSHQDHFRSPSLQSRRFVIKWAIRTFYPSDAVVALLQLSSSCNDVHLSFLCMCEFLDVRVLQCKSSRYERCSTHAKNKHERFTSPSSRFVYDYNQQMSQLRQFSRVLRNTWM